MSAVALTSGTSTGTPSGMKLRRRGEVVARARGRQAELADARAGVVSRAVFISSEAPQVLVRTSVNVVPSVLTASVYALMWPFRRPSKRGW